MTILEPHKHLERRTTLTLEGTQTWAQVGWLGQSGQVYTTEEDPSETERGGFSPLWLLLEDDKAEPDPGVG